MTNSRAKGARGELQVRDLLRLHGLEAERGQQHAGGQDSPDVRCPQLENEGFHIEVKLFSTCQMNSPAKISEWDAQVEKDSAGRVAAIFHRWNGQRFWWVRVVAAGKPRVWLPAEEFLAGRGFWSQS